ncbi:MAG TPA: nucleotidyltransferase family protein [Trichormus sp.]
MQLRYGPIDALLGGLCSQRQAFASAEARFLLSVVSAENRLTDSNQLDRLAEPEMSWSQLEKCDFAMAYLWQNLRQVEGAVPAEFLDVCKGYSRKILMMNELRIHTVTQLSQAASSAGLELVFVKGAAELCQFYSDATYLSQRSMGDLDLICAENDLLAIDVMMQKLGYYLSDYGASFASEQALRSFSLEHAGHLMYTNDSRSATGCVEVHIAPAVGRALQTYPDDFARQLLQQSRTVRIGTTDVRIPSNEHMVVYNLCHAASAKDQWVLAAVETTHFDQCLAGSLPSGIELVNARLDSAQLEFLFRLRNMLTAMGADLDRSQIVDLLRSVRRRRLLTMYLELAQTFLPDLCDFLGPSQSWSTIARGRNQFLLRTSFTQHAIARKAKYKLHLLEKLLRAKGRHDEEGSQLQVVHR